MSPRKTNATRLSSALPAEIRLALAVIGMRFGGPPPAVPADVDWDAFYDGVMRHRLPLLIDAAALPERAAMPDDCKNRLHAARRRTAVDALTAAAEALSVMEALRAAGIDALLLKGPAHGALFFNRLDRRWMRDLDVLVRPQDRSAALRALTALGYAAPAAAAARSPHASHDLRTVALVRPDRRFPVELHFCLEGEDDRILPLSLLDPFGNAEEISLGKGRVAVMNREASVVYAACHGGKHLWRQHFWICDVAAAQTDGRVDWAAATALAQRAGADRYLTVALILTEALFGLPIPAAVAANAERTAACRRLAEALIPALTDDDRDGATFRKLGRMRYLWWDLRMQTRTAARWAMLTAPWRPGARDVAFLTLPDRLGFLYPLVRAVRVTLERFRR